MKKALGMIEFKTVASGITATDIMLKTAEVDVVQATPVCPGKYLCTIEGEISSVKAAIEAAEAYNSAMLIDKFILGNPHESVSPAIMGALEIKNKSAIGIIETFTAASAQCSPRRPPSVQEITRPSLSITPKARSVNSFN